MVKITPMIRISNEASGFAALEILLAAALISIVSTVGLPQNSPTAGTRLLRPRKLRTAST